MGSRMEGRGGKKNQERTSDMARGESCGRKFRPGAEEREKGGGGVVRKQGKGWNQCKGDNNKEAGNGKPSKKENGEESPLGQRKGENSGKRVRANEKKEMDNNPMSSGLTGKKKMTTKIRTMGKKDPAGHRGAASFRKNGDKKTPKRNIGQKEQRKGPAGQRRGRKTEKFMGVGRERLHGHMARLTKKREKVRTTYKYRIRKGTRIRTEGAQN